MDFTNKNTNTKPIPRDSVNVKLKHRQDESAKAITGGEKRMDKEEALTDNEAHTWCVH